MNNTAQTSSSQEENQGMKSLVKLLTSFFILSLAACSTQQVHETSIDQSSNSEEALPEEHFGSMEGLTPPLTLVKGNKTLKLVRIMDGGACKNGYQGVTGAFLIYADTDDIERIKREKTPEIFKDFENKIQTFSSHVFQQAVEATNLAEDPFSIGADVTREKLTSQLVSNFRHAVSPAVDAFRKETSLTIDVTPFSPSFIFYQQGCDLNRLSTEI